VFQEELRICLVGRCWGLSVARRTQKKDREGDRYQWEKKKKTFPLRERVGGDRYLGRGELREVARNQGTDFYGISQVGKKKTWEWDCRKATRIRKGGKSRTNYANVVTWSIQIWRRRKKGGGKLISKDATPQRLLARTEGEGRVPQGGDVWN